MELEIVDMYAKKVYSSSNGFVIACGYSLNISALKTADGLYVAEMESLKTESSLVVTFENELEAMACVAMWIPEEHLDVLKGLTFHGLTYFRRGLPEQKIISDLLADAEAQLKGYIDMDMMVVPHLHGIPNPIGTVTGRIYGDDTRRRIGEKLIIETDFAEMERRVMALNINQAKQGSDDANN